MKLNFHCFVLTHCLLRLCTKCCCTTGVKLFVQKGEVDIDFFERVTEMVTFNNNIAIARANETLHSTGRMQNAGKKVRENISIVGGRLKRDGSLKQHRQLLLLLNNFNGLNV